MSYLLEVEKKEYKSQYESLYAGKDLICCDVLIGIGRPDILL